MGRYKVLTLVSNIQAAVVVGSAPSLLSANMPHFTEQVKMTFIVSSVVYSLGVSSFLHLYFSLLTLISHFGGKHFLLGSDGSQHTQS